MKKSVFYLMFIGLVVTSCSSGGSDNQDIIDVQEEEVSQDLNSTWIDFENEDGKFKVKLPGQPTQSSTKEPTVVGDILVEMFLYEESSTMAYIVGYNDYPSGLFEGADDEVYQNMLDGGVEGFTSNVGLDKIESKEDFTMGEGKGIFVKAKSTINTFHVFYKAIIVGNRLYQVGILRDGSYPAQDKSDAFFDSFEILK